MQRTEIRLEKQVSKWDAPELRINLTRSGADAGWIKVRFPEIIATNSADENKKRSYYQDTLDPKWPVTLECEADRKGIEWAGNDRNLAHTINFSNGMVLRSRARVQEDTIAITYEFDNYTERALENLTIITCVQAIGVPEIRDTSLRGTAVPQNGAFCYARDALPEIPDEGQYELYAFLAGSRPFPVTPTRFVWVHPNFPDDRDRDSNIFQVPDPADVPVIGMVAEDETWSIATSSTDAPRLWCNPIISCQHSDRIIESVMPGQVAKTGCTIHIVEGGLEALNERFLSAGRSRQRALESVRNKRRKNRA